MILQTKNIIYPESDGQPMAENTLQYDWISLIKWGLDELFADDHNVFIAGDLFWYPVEGNSGIRAAPDAMVVFGRPKGPRSSYLQWDEGGIAPQVVFEVLSPGNTITEMLAKHRFYDRYGVEEYYIYDPERRRLEGWLRTGGTLAEIVQLEGWTSPRLGVRFEMEDGELQIYRPDGRRLTTPLETALRAEAEKARAEAEKTRAEAEKTRAEAEKTRAEAEKARADAEKARADAERTRAVAEKTRADAQEARAEKLAAQLRALGQTPQG